MATKRKGTQNGGVVEKSVALRSAPARSVTGYMATRQFKLSAGDIYSGELLPEGLLRASEIAALVENGSLVRVYADGSSDPPMTPVEAIPVGATTVERMMLQPDTAVLRQLLSEPADVERCRAAQTIATSQGRTLMATALGVAVHYYLAGAHAPADRLG